MKKQLLLIMLPTLLFTATLQAQIKVWSFAGDNLPGYDNVLDTNTKVEAVLYSGDGANIAASGVANSDNTIGSFGAITDKVFYVNSGGGDRLRMQADTSTGFTIRDTETKTDLVAFFGAAAPWGRLYSNGNGSDSRRYYGFNLTTGEVITIYYYIDNSILNDVFVDFPTPANNVTFQIDNTPGRTGYMYQITATEDGLYKFYTTTGKLSVGRIYEGNVVLQDGVVLSNDKVRSAVSTNISAVGNRIYVSNVKSSTEINIYSITGALVKTFKTNEDTDFSFRSGLHIATVKTFEGQKAVKLLTH